MSDPDAEAWRIIRELRAEFIGRKRQPTDEDWAEFIAQGISRSNKPSGASVPERTDDYEDGYQDALDDIENAASNVKIDRRRRRNIRKVRATANA